MRKLFFLLACLPAAVMANNSATNYVNEFGPYYQALFKTSESTPQNALEALDNLVVTSPVEQAMWHLAYSHVYSNLDFPEKMLEHSNLGIKSLATLNEPWLKHFLNVMRVDAQERLGRGYKEMSSLKQTIEWATKNQHNSLAATALIQMSILHIRVENYSKALELIKQAAELAPTDGDIINKSDVDAEMASIYVYRNEFELAMPYFEASYEREKTNNNKLGMSIDLFEIGRANIELNNPELGIQQLNESILIAKEINDIQGIAYGSLELADHYFNAKEYAQAEQFLLTAKEKFQVANNNLMLFDTLILLSNVYTSSAQFDKAEQMLVTATGISQSTTNRYGGVVIKKAQAHLAAALNKHEEAYQLHLAADEEKNRIESKLSAEKLHEIRARYEIEANVIKNQLLEKQNDIQALQIAEQQKLQNLLVICLSILAVMLMLMLLLYLKSRKQRSKLHQLANFDELTGLMNRGNTINTIRKMLTQMDENDVISLVMIDLDLFKDINDTYGHVMGDKVLQEFGSYCADLSSYTPVIGRLGGEEFLLALVAQKPEDVYELIENLRVRTHQMPDALQIPGLKVSLSAGICHSHGLHRFREIFKGADVSMYQAKNNGRNQIHTSYLN